MSQISRQLNGKITHWVTSEDGFGGFNFDAPIVLNGRWEDSAVLCRSIDGEEVTSNAVCYLSKDVNVGDYVANGDQSDVNDPTTLSGAFRVQNFNKLTDLRNIEIHRKAFV